MVYQITPFSPIDDYSNAAYIGVRFEKQAYQELSPLRKKIAEFCEPIEGEQDIELENIYKSFLPVLATTNEWLVKNEKLPNFSRVEEALSAKQILFQYLRLAYTKQSEHEINKGPNDPTQWLVGAIVVQFNRLVEGENDAKAVPIYNNSKKLDTLELEKKLQLAGIDSERQTYTKALQIKLGRVPPVFSMLVAWKRFYCLMEGVEGFENASLYRETFSNLITAMVAPSQTNRD